MTEKMPVLEKPKMTVENAIVEIESIIQECYMMGANDYEIPTLQQLIENLRQGKVDPEEAVRQARQILASKQDYH